MEGGTNPLFYWLQPWKVFIKREGFSKRVRVSAGLWTLVIANLTSVLGQCEQRTWSKGKRSQGTQRVAERGNVDQATLAEDFQIQRALAAMFSKPFRT